MSVSLSFIDLMLCVGALDEPLGELAAAAVAVETHHEAVVVDLLHRAAGPLEVGARARGHDRVAVNRDQRVGRVVGALGIPRRGIFVLALAEPRLDHGLAATNRLVVRVIAVLDLLREQRHDRVRVVGPPRLDVVVQPASDVPWFHPFSFHRSARRSSLPDAVRGSSATNSTRLGTLYPASDAAQYSRSAASSVAAPSRRTTTASTASCHSGSERPTAAASATSGWRRRTSSTSAGSTFSPPETITSPSRSST